jgi:hypothetical protein
MSLSRRALKDEVLNELFRDPLLCDLGDDVPRLYPLG